MQFANVSVNYRPQTIAHQVFGNHNQVKPKFVSLYEFNKDNPFIELFFHYNLNNRSYLSPISFGRPDPIEEFAQKLKGSGNKEDYQLSKKLEAKMRTFAPVIVRGEESQGVKFWGFGKTGFIKNYYQS